MFEPLFLGGFSLSHCKNLHLKGILITLGLECTQTDKAPQLSFTISLAKENNWPLLN